MKTSRKKGFWTKSVVLKEARRYSTPSEFWTYSRGAASAAKRGGYYNKATAHMKKVERLPRGHYQNLENIFRAYASVKTRTELHQKYLGAINMAIKLGLHDMLISGIPERVRQPVIGKKERVLALAKEYDDVKTFAEREPGAYHAASRLGILSKITKHMNRRGNIYKRFVYQVFNKEYCYIGLTVNVERRLAMHRSSIHALRFELFNSPDSTIIVSDLLEAEKARKLEEKLIRKYRKEGRLIVLNRNSGGGLGSPCRVETLETLIEKARGKTATYLKRHHPGTYKSICKLPVEQKEKVKAVMRRLISVIVPDDQILEFCNGKTMAELRMNFPGVRKRIYSHPDKEKILATLGHQIRSPRLK